MSKCRLLIGRRVWKIVKRRNMAWRYKAVGDWKECEEGERQNFLFWYSESSWSIPESHPLMWLYLTNSFDIYTKINPNIKYGLAPKVGHGAHKGGSRAICIFWFVCLRATDNILIGVPNRNREQDSIFHLFIYFNKHFWNGQRPMQSQEHVNSLRYHRIPSCLQEKSSFISS